MIKGLYFKLDSTKARDNYIHNFFNRMKARHINKVDCLYYMCRMFDTANVRIKTSQGDQVIKLFEELSNGSSWGSLIADINDNSKEEKIND